MSHWRCYSLTYRPDCQGFVQALLAYEAPIWLDSCAFATAGRYDIIAAEPYAIIKETLDGGIEVSGLTITPHSEETFLSFLRRINPIQSITLGEFAFSGAMGFFTYEHGVHQHGIATHKTASMALPLAWFGLYYFAVVLDHKTQQAHLLYREQPEQKLSVTELKTLWEEGASNTSHELERFKLLQPFSSNMTYQAYVVALKRIREHLLAGDSYQVNFSHCFTAPYEGDAFIAYCYLRKKNPVSYAAFLRLPEADILSFSPELLVEGKERKLITKPIKGTAARANHECEDLRRKQALAESEKDRAENMMIVDLLRNDLSRVCTVESVNVDAYWQIETLASVFHLVSTVSGELEVGKDYIDVMEALFPGGSITGAPKYKTMQLIEQYELAPRSIYCGSIGFISGDQRMCFNIAIRTLTAAHGELSCHAGGGIVIDSTCGEEYQETLDKVSILTHTLLTMGEREVKLSG